MKKHLLLLLIALQSIAVQAQLASIAPLNLTGMNTYPRYYSIPSHDVLWGCVQGFNSGTYNSKTFFRTTDAGATFTVGTIPEPADRGTCCVSAINADTAWIGLTDINISSGGSIWKTTDGGQTWVQQTTTEFSSGSAVVDLICFFNADSGLAVGDPQMGYFEIYTTADGGTTWTPVPQSNMPASFSGEYAYQNNYARIGDRIWFSTSSGRVIYSYDKGYTWDVSTLGAQSFNITMNDENNGCATAYSSSVYVTNDGGFSWTSFSPALHVYEAAALPGRPGCYVFRSDLGLYATGDNFQTWFLISGTLPNGDGPIEMYDATIGWTDAGSWDMDSSLVKIEDVLASTFSIEANRQDLSVFPNPVRYGAAMTSFTLDRPEEVVLSLKDISGKIVRQQRGSATKGSNTFTFDFKNIARGLYLLDLAGSDSHSVQKVIVE